MHDGVLTLLVLALMLARCTMGYSLAFVDWSYWEKHIDWMALNGINLPLSFVGQEWLWQEVGMGLLCFNACFLFSLLVVGRNCFVGWSHDQLRCSSSCNKITNVSA